MTRTPIKNDELAAMRETLKPISDLKPGDKVRWKKDGMKNMNSPCYGEEIEVFRVSFTPGKNRAEAIIEYDFTALFRDDDGDVVEFPFDSRRFERVEAKEERKDPPVQTVNAE